MSVSLPQRAFFIDPTGKTVAVPLEKAADVGQYGDYAPASVSQIRDYLLQERYGGTGSALVGGLESAGSMATLGLSTVLERAAGVSPEGIKGREEANPLISGTGSAVGILVPLLLTGGASAAVEGAEGASAAARAASMAGPSLLAKVGKGVAKAAMRDLPEDASLVQRLAAKGLSAAAGGAVEGAGYEAGQLVHEAALGDPNLTAEAALARVGLSAATFGALSGGGGILGALAHEAVGSATTSDLGKKVADWLGDVEARGNIKSTMAEPSVVGKLDKKMGREGLNKLIREAGDAGLFGVAGLGSAESTFERATAYAEKAGTDMRTILRDADAATLDKTGAAAIDTDALVSRMRGEVLEPLSKDIHQRAAASKFATLLDDLAAKYPEGMTLEELHQERRLLDNAIKWDKLVDPGAYKEALRDSRGIVSEEIFKGVSAAGLDSAEWKALNRQYQVGATVADLARSGMKRGLKNNAISTGEGLGLIGGLMTGHPLAGMAASAGTAVARRAVPGATAWLARGLRGLLEGEEGALVANGTAEAIAAERRAALGQAVPGAAFAKVASSASAAPETAAALSVLARARAKVTEEIDAALKGLIKNGPTAVGRAGAAAVSRHAASAVEARRAAASPELLQEALARQTDELHGHAPSVAQAAQLTSARALAFLALKAPATALPGLHGKAARPSAAEFGKFSRHAEVVHQPLQVLEHAKRGTLTPEHVTSLQAVYPALSQHIQERAIDAMMEAGGRVTHPQARMLLSMLTGFRLDGGFNSVAANQAVFARTPDRSIMDRPVPNPNAGKLNMANRVRTPTQGLSERLNGGK